MSSNVSGYKRLIKSDPNHPHNNDNHTHHNHQSIEVKKNERKDFILVKMESEDNLMTIESYPPTIKKPSTLSTSSPRDHHSSPSSSSSSSSSSVSSTSQPSTSTTATASATTTAWNDEQSTIKPRKPRLLRQPNALIDISPNQSSGSLGDHPIGGPSTSTSSNITTILRPVPQVSVTLSSPDNPFDDSSIEYIDSDLEGTPTAISSYPKDAPTTSTTTATSSSTTTMITTTIDDAGKTDSYVNDSSSNENTIESYPSESIESNHSNSLTNEQKLVETLTDTRKTKYLTRTLALLKLQYLRKSRSEDTGDPETRNMRRLSERPGGLIGDSNGLMIQHAHHVHHHGHSHGHGHGYGYGYLHSHHSSHHHSGHHSNHLLGPVNKSLSSASLCGNSLATSPPASFLRSSLSGGSGGSGSNQVEPEPYILGIHIHNTDRKLKSSKSVVHPVVKIHIMDSESASYLVKKHPDRDVAFYYETGNSRNNFILPVMTQNCDMLTRIRYPRYPIWEELLLYNEDYSYFLSDNVVIFLEILDFLTFSGPSDKRYNSMKRNEWWYRIAWAFLSLKSSDGSFNTGRKVRLQLYKPLSQKVSIDPKNPHTTELFDWWKNHKLIPFPGSIYVTVSPIPLIVSRETFSPSFRSYGPFQPEIKSDSICNQTHQHHHHHHHHHHQTSAIPRRPSSAISNSTIERSPSTISNPPVTGQQQSAHISKSLDTSLESRLGTGDQAQPLPGYQLVKTLERSPSVIWSRLEGAPCKIPKNLWHQFSAGNNKCSYAIKFSWDGRRVACGASVFTAYRSNEKRSSIFIYEIPSGRFVKRVNGFHSGAIYEIDWSPNDKYLVSASSDCTAHVWNNVKEYQSSILLPHPCFVYTARFHVTRSGIVFTGSYDGLIRIWCIKLSLESTAVEPQLVQEIDCFYGQVLSLAWKISPPPPQPQPQPPTTSSTSLTKSNTNIDSIASDTSSLPIVTLFASGSKGEIVTLSQRDLTSDFTWYLSGSIKINEIIEVPINNIVVHPQSNKILIFCRDGVQRMIDYQLEIIVQRFTGSLNFHHLIRGCLSSCGRFVFAGGEDSLVHCWNADSGEKLFTYNELPFKGPISCVEYHPFDNIIAICGLNARTISVCLFNHELPKLVSAPPVIKSMVTPSSSSTSTSPKQSQPPTHGHSNKPDSKSNNSSHFVLARSKTIDQTNNNNVSESGAIRRGNFKVQRAMRRLEFALRTKSIDKK